MERSDSLHGAAATQGGGSGGTGADAPPVLGRSGERRPLVSGVVRGGVTPPRAAEFIKHYYTLCRCACVGALGHHASIVRSRSVWHKGLTVRLLIPSCKPAWEL